MIQSSINFARRQLFSNCHWSCGTISSLHDSIGSGAVVVYLKRKFIHKYMQCDLSMCSQKAEQCLTLLRLDSIQSLTPARLLLDGLLGLECKTGLQTRVNPRYMHHADVVNLVGV